MTNTSNGSFLPRQDVPEKDKNDAWKSEHLNYAEAVLRNYNGTRQKMTRMFNGYMGVKDPTSYEWITKTYGQENRAQFLPWRLSKVKIDLLQGEQLKRPLEATVTTVNSQAVSEKMKRYDFIKGAMLARDEIKAVKDIAGVDIMEGIQIPEDETAFAKMSFKDKTEVIMQVMLNKQKIRLDLRKKLSESFLNLELTNYCFGSIEMDQDGNISFNDIDPRNSIFEYVDGDYYLEKSPIIGCRRVLPVHEILLRYDLTKAQRDKLEAARQNPSQWIGSNGYGRGYMSMSAGGQLQCDVIHIEWDSLKPYHEKRVKKTQSQLLVDPSDKVLTFEMDTAKYENNKAYHDANVAKGDYEIVTKYIEERYEATRIGGVIDVDMRPVQGKKRSSDNPSKVTSSTYIGYIHNIVNGITVSLQEVMENYSNLFDLVQYQKNKEIAKLKGKILTIDRASLGQKQKLEDLLYRMVNDQLLDYDSSAAGNIGNRNLDPKAMFQQFDLGLTESFSQLLTVEQNIIANVNQITGINENRQGNTAASSTATAQQSDIANSRTITEGLFYGFSGFTKRVMKAVVDKTAVSAAFYQAEMWEAILGTEMYSFLDNSIDLVYRDYGVEIEDGSRYMEISQKIERMMEFSLNAKEIRPMDALNVLLSETVAEKRVALEQSWIQMQKIMQDSAAQEQQANAQMNQEQMQTQIQIAQENREDLQKQEMDAITLKGQVQMEVDNNKAQHDERLQQQKSMADIVIKSDPTTM